MAKDTKTEVSATAKEGAVQKAQPVRAVSPFEEMERMMEGFFPRGWMRPMLWDRPFLRELALPFEGKLPRVDVVDRDAEILVRAEIPGVDKKDLEVSVSENTVTITGKTGHEEKEEKGNYYRCEVSRGAFTRTVSLPSDVDADKASTSFKDGLLELTLPKVTKSKRRTIKVD